MPTVDDLVSESLVRAVVPMDAAEQELFTASNPGEVSFEHDVDVNILRQTRYQQVTIREGEAVTAEIDCRGYTMFTLQMPADWTLANIGFLTARQSGGTFRPYHDASGELLELETPTAGYHYELPTNLAGVLFMQIWSERDRHDEAQDDERVFTITLKA